MKEIKLSTNGEIVTLDDNTYKWLSNYKWHLCHGYAQTNIKINNKYKTKRMHRLIMGEPDGFEIDHIDGNKLNNLKSNLRIVTNYQNQMNSKGSRNSSSKFKGVSWDKNKNKWFVQIMFNRKNIYIGRFKFEMDAAIAYNIKAKELFGEYARLNEVD